MAPLRDLALVVGATARVTRFFTSDTLGYWLAVEPARRWANFHERSLEHPDGQPTLEWGQNARTVEAREHTLRMEPDPDNGWRSKLVSGLDCPHCVGTWVGYAAIGSYLFARRWPATLAVWRFLAAGLGLNYVTGHVSSRID